MMKVLFMFSIALVAVSAQRCKPKYHFWRPYNGTIPRDAFVAATDEDGTKSYVAKIVPMDQYSWTVPTQFKDGGCDHIDFSWCCKSNSAMRVDEFIETIPVQFKEGWDHIDFSWCCKTNNIIKVDEFIEIMCSEEPNQLSWEKVYQHVEEIRSRCCPIEGGIGFRKGRKLYTYVGRTLTNGVHHIGRVYKANVTDGVHINDGVNVTKTLNDFEVLSYDCRADEPSLPAPE